MIVSPITTRILHPGEDLTAFVLEHVPRPAENTILAVTSKIVSLSERRLVSPNEIDKGALVRRESDVYLGEIGYGTHLTVKQGLLIASAGIDESNSETGDFILYPEKPYFSAQRLWRELREKWELEHLGILLTDSKTTPLRRGTSGIALAYWGFEAVKNLVGTPDLFGRLLKMTTINAADALSAAAVYTMGEGRESRPLAVIQEADVTFTRETNPAEIEIPLEEDLYYPLIRGTLSP